MKSQSNVHPAVSDSAYGDSPSDDKQHKTATFSQVARLNILIFGTSMKISMLYACYMMLFVTILEHYSATQRTFPADGIVLPISVSYVETAWYVLLHYPSAYFGIAACTVTFAVKKKSDSFWKTYFELPLIYMVGGWLISSIGNVLRIFQVITLEHAVSNAGLAMLIFMSLFFWKIGKKYSSNVTRSILVVFITLAIMLVALSFTNATHKIKHTQDEQLKMMIIVLLLPAIRDVGYTFIRSFICYNIKISNTHATQLLVLPYVLYMTWMTRFLYVNLASYTSIIMTVVLNGAQELFLRHTHRQRSYLFYKMQEAVWRVLFGQTEVKAYDLFNTPHYKAHLSIMMIMEMVTEYIAIFTSMLAPLLFDPVRATIDLGFDGLQPIRYNRVLFTFFLQVVVELVIDSASLNYEIRHCGLPLLREWKERLPWFSVVYFVLTLYTFSIFIWGFQRHFPDCHSEYFCTCYQNLTYSVQQEWCKQWLFENNDTSVLV